MIPPTCTCDDKFKIDNYEPCPIHGILGKTAMSGTGLELLKIELTTLTAKVEALEAENKRLLELADDMDDHIDIRYDHCGCPIDDVCRYCKDGTELHNKYVEIQSELEGRG